MELKKFVANFSGQFEESDVKNINEEVDFKSLETWDSLTAMSVQVMIEDEYRVKIAADDLDKAITVKDLFTMVQSKLNLQS